MSLKFRITKAEWDGLDEGIRKLYGEKDGNYQLTVDGLDDAAELKVALNKERQRASEFEKIVKQWNGTGKKPEEVVEMLRKAAEEEEQRKKDKGEYESIITQLKESKSKELALKDEALKTMRQTLDSYLIDAEATRVLSESGGNATLLLPHVKKATQVVEDKGAYAVRVIGSDGNPRVNSKGEYLGIKELVEEMKENESFQCAFAPSDKKGGGAGGSGGGASGAAFSGNPWKKETWNLTEQYRLYKENPVRAKAMAQEAGVTLP
ncbi:hypothetical protein [Cloacibacillus porcorum]|jgi:hypothetical protein|uniref:hypothetical protein n=1 Tax=Cloacibacillus porcorum TaxID=1197717 RepID=UPI002673DEAD|nr:hypothetical protein [Cloacibacillus porcorum]